MLKGMHEVTDEVLGLVEGLPNLGLFPLRYEVEMGVTCSTLLLFMRKREICRTPAVGHYGEISNGMEQYLQGRGGWESENNFENDERKLGATDCPNRWTWIVKFMRGAHLRMGIIRKQEFGI